MDILKICTFCQNDFDNCENLPRILPCSNLICSSCVNQNYWRLGQYLIYCGFCGKYHKTNDFENNWPKSQLAINCFDTDTNNCIIKIKETAENYSNFFEIEKYQLINQLEENVSSVDLKAETLINLIQDTRESLISEVKSSFIIRNEEIESLTRDMIQKFKEVNLHSLNDKHCLRDFIKDFNDLQNLTNNLKNNSLSFKPRSSDKTILGFFYNNNSQAIYKKIEALGGILEENENFILINPNSFLRTSCFKRYYLPINLKRLLCVNFNFNRIINLQMYNSNGELKKSFEFPQSIEYFPLVHSLKNCFIMIYRISNQVNFCREKSFIILFDYDLKVLKSIEDFGSIQNVYATDDKILIFQSYRITDVIKVMDYNLDIIKLFGQTRDALQPFYFKVNKIEASFISSYFFFPVIFGYKNDKVYMYDDINVYVMCLSTGIYLETTKKRNQEDMYILDSFNNIIEYNSFTRNVKISNSDNNIEGIFPKKFDKLYLIEDKYFAFVDKITDTIIII